VSLNATFEQGGALTTQATVSWTPYDLLQGGTVPLKAGAQLLVTVGSPTLGANVTRSVTLNGSAIALSGTGHSAILPFATPGTYTLVGTLAGANGNILFQGTTTVLVQAYTFPRLLPSMVDRTRSVDTSAIPSGVLIDADPRLKADSSAQGAASQLSWQSTDSLDYRMVARLGAHGPILGATAAPASALYTSFQTYTEIVATLDKDTYLVETMVILSPVRPDHAVRLRIKIAGVLFEDGTREKILQPGAFDATGVARVRYLWPKTGAHSVCHTSELLYLGAPVGCF
jgi:hypothetical protein